MILNLMICNLFKIPENYFTSITNIFLILTSVITFFNAGVWVFGPLYAQFIGPSVDSNFPKLKPEHLIPFCVQTAVVLAHLFVLFTLKPKKKGGRKSS